ncbi:hypothetical protein HID58_018440 [Brassica napus]|uniref:Uncharacterized protein n=1 Tax=Brassica napus TaxID=3708 RepID=A0ABQ8DA00_BRANA|nr:hypothetical protein HID58_018440 [Brassica napus]
MGSWLRRTELAIWRADQDRPRRRARSGQAELAKWQAGRDRPSSLYGKLRLDDVYYPFENNISWLTTRRDEMKQNLAMLQKQHGVGARISTLIDDSIQTSINARFTSFKDRLQSFTYRLDGTNLFYIPLE